MRLLDMGKHVRNSRKKKKGEGQECHVFNREQGPKVLVQAAFVLFGVQS